MAEVHCLTAAHPDQNTRDVHVGFLERWFSLETFSTQLGKEDIVDIVQTCFVYIIWNGHDAREEPLSLRICCYAL